MLASCYRQRPRRCSRCRLRHMPQVEPTSAIDERGSAFFAAGTTAGSPAIPPGSERRPVVRRFCADSGARAARRWGCRSPCTRVVGMLELGAKKRNPPPIPSTPTPYTRARPRRQQHSDHRQKRSDNRQQCSDHTCLTRGAIL
eukprot:1701372-Prymnesium_polylepis.1